MRDPSDPALLAEIQSITGNETEIGTTDMVPWWKGNPSVDPSVQVYTLSSITGGTGSYNGVYEHVSFAMPDTAKMPAFYTDIANLYSIFGGSAKSVPIQEGIEATFLPVTPNDNGYPDSAWTYNGRDMS